MLSAKEYIFLDISEETERVPLGSREVRPDPLGISEVVFQALEF